MDIMTQDLPNAEWIEEQAALEPEAEHAEAMKAIRDYKDIGKQNEAEMGDILSALKIKPSELDERERKEAEFATALADTAETELAGQGPGDDLDIARQITLETNILPETVSGTSPGNYYDHTPYNYWQRWYTHREGGSVEGRVSCDVTGRRLRSYSRARGDGAGFWNDNYTTSWTKFYYAFWPRRNGHVRAYVPFQTRGWYQIYANDKWYNDKSAKIEVDFSVKLRQNYWGGAVNDRVFSRRGDNINQNGRVDMNRSLYSGSIPVGANKWVIAEVAVRNYVHAQGGGSNATMSFWAPDRVFVPYVRFDFS